MEEECLRFCRAQGISTPFGDQFAADCGCTQSISVRHKLIRMSNEVDEWAVVVRGAGATIKRGATYKNIRLTTSDDEVEVR